MSKIHMIEFYSFSIFTGANWVFRWIFNKNVIIGQNNPNNVFVDHHLQ